MDNEPYDYYNNDMGIKVKLSLFQKAFCKTLSEDTASIMQQLPSYIKTLSTYNQPDKVFLLSKVILLQEHLHRAISSNLSLMELLMYSITTPDNDPNELEHFIEGACLNIHPSDKPSQVNTYLQSNLLLPQSNQVVPEIGYNGPGFQLDEPNPLALALPDYDIANMNNYLIQRNSTIDFNRKVTINSTDDLSAKQAYLMDNTKDITKIKLSNLICEDINLLFKVKNTFSQLSKLNIKNSSFDNSSLRKIIPNLTYLKFSKMQNSISSYHQFLIFPKLQELHLIAVNLKNKTFKSVMNTLYSPSNEEMSHSLQLISFKGNKITRVSLGFPKNRFDNLHTIDFEGNKLHTFVIESFISLKSLRYLNLSNNDFLYNNTFTDLLQRAAKGETNPLILFGHNPFLIKESSYGDYIAYLTTFLDNINNSQEMHSNNAVLSSLNLDYLFNRSSKSLLVDQWFNYHSIWNHLTELNLMSCQLTNEDIGKIFNDNHNSFEGLKKLNLASNEIDDSLFKIINAQGSEILKKLKDIDLSHTLIKGKDQEMIEFIRNTTSLKKMMIYATPFEDFFGMFLRGMLESMRKTEVKDKDKEKPIMLKCEIEAAMNEIMSLLNTIDSIGGVKLKFYLISNSTTVCRKIQKNPPDCSKYFEVKEL